MTEILNQDRVTVEVYADSYEFSKAHCPSPDPLGHGEPQDLYYMQAGAALRAALDSLRSELVERVHYEMDIANTPAEAMQVEVALRERMIGDVLYGERMEMVANDWLAILVENPWIDVMFTSRGAAWRVASTAQGVLRSLASAVLDTVYLKTVEDAMPKSQAPLFLIKVLDDASALALDESYAEWVAAVSKAKQARDRFDAMVNNARRL